MPVLPRRQKFGKLLYYCYTNKAYILYGEPPLRIENLYEFFPKSFFLSEIKHSSLTHALFESKRVNCKPMMIPTLSFLGDCGDSHRAALPLGVEPRTYRLRGECSNQLSYESRKCIGGDLNPSRRIKSPLHYHCVTDANLFSIFN